MTDCRDYRTFNAGGSYFPSQPQRERITRVVFCHPMLPNTMQTNTTLYSGKAFCQAFGTQLYEVDAMGHAVATLPGRMGGLGLRSEGRREQIRKAPWIGLCYLGPELVIWRRTAELDVSVSAKAQALRTDAAQPAGNTVGEPRDDALKTST